MAPITKCLKEKKFAWSMAAAKAFTEIKKKKDGASTSAQVTRFLQNF
jgi:hypothetical protein